VRIEVGVEPRQRFGHVFAAVAEADVTRLVVDGSWEEQDARIADDFLAKLQNVSIGL
jgi:hypothetical protein